MSKLCQKSVPISKLVDSDSTKNNCNRKYKHLTDLHAVNNEYSEDTKVVSLVMFNILHSSRGPLLHTGRFTETARVDELSP